MWKRICKYGILIPWLLVLILSGCDSIGSLFQGSTEEENLTSQDSSVLEYSVSDNKYSDYASNDQNRRRGFQHCTGFIIHNHHLITAAFCVRLRHSMNGLSDSQKWDLVPPEDDSRCSSLNPKQFSLTLLDIPNGTTDLTLHITIPGGVPGLSLEASKEDEEWQYSATLGTTEAKHCGLQGFPDRLYCSFTLPSSALGTTQPLEIKANTCPGAIFSHPYVSILPPSIIKPDKSDEKLTCSSDLGKSDCEASGGSYIKLNDYICVCP